MVMINLALVVILIIATAFFVATEFSIIRVRPSRVNQLVHEGKKNALAVQKVTNNIDGYLSACQLGITITALGLGWLGKPTVEVILYPVFSYLGLTSNIGDLISFIIAFSIITFLHVVVGELAPKTIAIQKAEQISRLFARPIIFFYRIPKQSCVLFWQKALKAAKLIRRNMAMLAEFLLLMIFSPEKSWSPVRIWCVWTFTTV